MIMRTPEHDPARDPRRLTRRLGQVYEALRRAWPAWRTVPELARELREAFPREGLTETGTSARVRDLRKPEHGAHRVKARQRPGTRGVWEYRLEDPELAEGDLFTRPADPATAPPGWTT